MNPSPDAMAALADLLVLMTKPAAFKAKLSELRRTIERAETATAKLEAASRAHDQKIAADRAEMATREQRVRDREVAVAIAERNLGEREKIIADAKPQRYRDDPNLGPGGRSHSGLTREPHHG
jgi:hypothetical protein